MIEFLTVFCNFYHLQLEIVLTLLLLVTISPKLAVLPKS